MFESRVLSAEEWHRFAAVIAQIMSTLGGRAFRGVAQRPVGCSLHFMIGCLLGGSALGVEAQSLSTVEIREIQCQGDMACLEESGVLTFSPDETQRDRSYVLRYPEDPAGWNGALVIGVHGETGSRTRYDRDGTVIGTHETQLDDMIGRYALNEGYAYASVERGGFGGRERALWLLSEFSSTMRIRMVEGLGREPERLYAVGWSTGGTLARYAAEEETSPIDGVVVVAGVGGKPQEVTGVPLVPVIEIVGTDDARVVQQVRAYRDLVNRLSASGEASLPDRLRLYEVAGANHVSPEDDDAPSFEEERVGRVPYFQIVQDGLDLLDRWVRHDVPPPADRLVVPTTSAGRSDSSG